MCALCVVVVVVVVVFNNNTTHTHTHTHARCARKYFKKVLNISKKLQLFFFAVKKKKLSKTSFSRQCIARCVFRWSDFAFFFLLFLLLRVCAFARTQIRKRKKKKKWIYIHIFAWLILPVVICLSQRLNHACLSITQFIWEDCEYLLKSAIVSLIITEELPLV